MISQRYLQAIAEREREREEEKKKREREREKEKRRKEKRKKKASLFKKCFKDTATSGLLEPGWESIPQQDGLK